MKNRISYTPDFDRPIADQIADKYGNHAAVMDTLHYHIERVRVGNTRRWVDVRIAFPINEKPTAENVCMSVTEAIVH